MGGSGLSRSSHVFRGATKVTLDDKGRMVMPTRYRESIQERAQNRLVITVHRDPCLLIYPSPDWELTEQKLLALPSMHPQASWLQRVVVGYATDLELDGHGRFLVPPELREIAGLQRLAMLIGQGSRFELWDETRWNEQRDLYLKQDAAAAGQPSLLDSVSL